MQKQTPFVSTLLTITALVTFVGGIIIAIMVYVDFIEAMRNINLPGVKLDRSLAIWTAGATIFGFYVISLVLAALAQITESTAFSAYEAETQTEYLRQIAASTTGKPPSVDDIARMVASKVHVQPRQ